MKSLMLMLSCLLMALAGCLAPRSRYNVMLPAAQAAWPNVKADVERGLQVATDGGTLDATSSALWNTRVHEVDMALANGSWQSIHACPWQDVKPWAEFGFQYDLAMEKIGTTVADSLRERIVRFDELMIQLGGG